MNRLKNNDPYPGFVPVPNRGYFTLGPNIDQASKEALEEKLEILPKMVELQDKAHQRLAMVPHEKRVNQATIRVYEYPDFLLGVMFIVYTETDECDYTVCLMPTKKDVDDYNKDCDEVGRKCGFKPEVWKN